MEPERDSWTVVSYLTLRRLIGMLGMAMPIAVAVWGLAVFDPPTFLESISDYHVLPTGVVFAGVLWTMGWFLFAYRGYDKLDDRVCDAAGGLALCVSLLPNDGPGAVAKLHFVSAACLFLILAFISAFLFTKSSGDRTPRKQLRDKLYRGCGIAIVTFIGLIAVYKWAGWPAAPDGLKPVFWLETLSLWAFGLSWLVKGETLWKDRPLGGNN